MSKAHSCRWKTLERTVANTLGGVRVVEDWTLFRQRPDVIVQLDDNHRLIVECKAYSKFAHHTLLEGCQAKYCGATDIPALATKAAGQHGEFITVPLSFFADVLKHYHPNQEGTKNHE